MALSEEALLVLMQHLGKSGPQNIAVWRKKQVINVQREFLCLYLEFLFFSSFEHTYNLADITTTFKRFLCI